MRFLLVGFLVLTIYVVGEVLRTRHLIQVGNTLAAQAIPFSRPEAHPNIRILVVGDSTGVGTGASSSSTSLAGLIGRRYPQAEIVNLAVNGAKTGEVPQQLEKATGSFDLILVHIGGNDTVRFTDSKTLRQNIRTVLDTATKRGKHILLTTTGDVGTVPLFPAPTRWIFAKRTKTVRTIFQEEVAASQGDVRYTDLLRSRENDPFARDPKAYYAADSFHPSDLGYADWFELMGKELDQFGL